MKWLCRVLVLLVGVSAWSYAINDMDIVIDEDRTVVEATTMLDDLDDPLDSSPLEFSLRYGGGRNVTLTLPDGRRTTFRFTFAQTTSGDVCLGCADAQWVAAPGVFATLKTPNPATKESIGDNTLIPLPGFGFVWQAGGFFTPVEAFDFPEFVLTTQDGTRYEIVREPELAGAPTYGSCGISGSKIPWAPLPLISAEIDVNPKNHQVFR